MSTSQADVEVQRFQGHGITVVGDVAGPADGPPVILLHGGGQTRQSWGAALRQGARRGYRMLSLDLRGHGESDWSPEGDYSSELMVGDLAEVVRTLKSPPVLVGASMGGLVSLGYAGNGGTARGLVLVDITPRIEPTGTERIGNFMRSAPNGFANLDEAADAVAAYLPNRPRPKDTSGLMKNLRLRDDGRLHWHWDPAMMQNNRPRNLDHLREAARRLTIPTLLIRGGQSEVVSPEGVRDFLELVPHAEFVDVAGADHMVAGDKNDAFNAAMFGFVSRIAPVGA